MCTSMVLRSDNSYFGRNMDIENGFGQRIIITPRNHIISFKRVDSLNKHYSIIGMGTVIDNYPLYADATNEFGLSIASLAFPDNAYYEREMDIHKYNVTPSELILWILGQCRTIDDTVNLLNKTNIIDIYFNDNIPLTPLHWHIADKEKSITVEVTKTGMHIYDNKAEILTNNPEFSFHMNNLALYLNLETHIPTNCFTDELGIKPFCKGIGSIGLPGDYSSTSRFIKTAYLLLNSKKYNDDDISRFFHILDSVFVVDGCIVLKNVSDYLTLYTSCVNIDKCIYYYKSYNNSRITAVNMWDENVDSNELITFSLKNNQDILLEN